MATNETRVHFLAPIDLIEAFDRTVQAQDLTRSQAVRKMMRDYVRHYGQADMFNESRKKRGK